MTSKIFGALVVAVLFLAALAACSAGPVDEHPVGPSGLVLTRNTSDEVAGTFSTDGARIQLAIQRDTRCQTVRVWHADGSPLLRASSCVDADSYEIGAGRFVVQGGPGGLFGDYPTATRIVTMGSPEELEEMVTDPGFALFVAAAAALEATPGVAPALLPPHGLYKLSAAMRAEGQNASAEGRAAGAALSHDPVGCGFCHGSCGLIEAGCVLAAGWFPPALIVCAVSAVICHGSCAGTACQ
jgi:hypothetical protein